MRALARSRNSVESARRILNALQAADLPALERALQGSAELLPPPAGLSAEEAERRELLVAVADRMCCALGSLRRGVSRSLDGLETWVGLLDHLARSTPQPIPLRIR